MYTQSTTLLFTRKNMTTQLAPQKRKCASELLSIALAARWATNYLKKEVSESNISYLIQYGKIKKYGQNGSPLIAVDDLRTYYNSYKGKREINWKRSLGKDINWALSFDHLREKDTTKHVHRLHPYKGKFIPQLVEYFIDSHINDFKKEIYFKKGDIILDPFSGSGTTLVQANELGLHSIGIDISHFNCTIAEAKLTKCDLRLLQQETRNIIDSLFTMQADSKIEEFTNELSEILAKFNTQYFPSPSFKYKLNRGEIQEDKYAKEKELLFLKTYKALINKYHIKLEQSSIKTFLDKWYCNNIRKEIDFVFKLIKQIRDAEIRKVLSVILSRTIRSCRATTHSDLATLKNPQLVTYYCYKHKKICRPIFSIKNMFLRYAKDTTERLKEFSNLRSSSFYALIPNDSRKININMEIKKTNQDFFSILAKQGIKGIFSSPPYVGQIDYHEQHAYAYDLLGCERQDELEIGPLYKGQGEEARKTYVNGISSVLINCKKYLVTDFNVFLVANDKYNLYPTIAEKAGMSIVNTHKRPVLNRTERSRMPYSEIIFHLRNKL
jgi:hypothetical protein